VAAYLPSGAPVLLALAALLAAALLATFVLMRHAPGRGARPAAWILLVGAVAAVDRLCLREPAGFRMLALIAAGLLGMKAIVLVEERRRGAPPLAPARWLGFTLAWPGMQPRLFARPVAGALPGARALLGRGAVRLAGGVLLIALSRLAWAHLHSRALASIGLLAGLSLVLHFGLCNLMAGAWRARGLPTDALFRAPLRSQSLGEFWARRWNLAFSEMTSIAVYRPLSRGLGRGPAIFAGFLASGLLHEMAISLPVRAGFGWPMLYFALHGGLVLVERALTAKGHPLGGWAGRAWTVLWLVAPLPLLFHRWFLEGVLWPLIGIPPRS
jgi:hypothetical protein